MADYRAKRQQPNILRFITDIRLWYAVSGILISIIAHELFHIIVHFGEIQRIEFFPDFQTIMAIVVDSPGILTGNSEELIAYSITALILFITIIDVFAISDSRDRRTVKETLYPSRSTQRRPTVKGRTSSSR